MSDEVVSLCATVIDGEINDEFLDSDVMNEAEVFHLNQEVENGVNLNLENVDNIENVENIPPEPVLDPQGGQQGTFNKYGFLNLLYYEGHYYAFKGIRISKTGEIIGLYRCRHYKPTESGPGCKTAFSLFNNTLTFNMKEHTCAARVNKRRRITVTDILDISFEMKEYVEGAAINDVSKAAKTIALEGAEHFREKYIGIPSKTLNLKQMQALVYAARRRQFSNSEGLITSYPADRCSLSDQRYFLQFFTRIIVNEMPHKLIGWSYPELKRELLYENCLIVMVYSVPHDMYVPAFFVLMTGKEADLYHHALQSILSACDWRLFFKTVTSDFEMALVKSIKDQFPEARTVGCFFHFKQALSRKLKNLGVSEAKTFQFLNGNGLLNLLTVIPPEEIESKGIPYIKAKFDVGEYGPQFNAFWIYFTETWIRKFPPTKFWNFHDVLESNSFDRDLVNKTNNPCESFNNKLNARFPTNGRPSLVNFVEGIRAISQEYKATLDLSHRGQRGVHVRAHQEPQYFNVPRDYHTFTVEPNVRRRGSQRI